MRISVKASLLVPVLALAGLLIFNSTMGLKNVSDNHRDTVEITDRLFPAAQALERIRYNTMRYRALVARAVANVDPTENGQIAVRQQETLAELNREVAGFEGHAEAPASGVEWPAIRARLEAYIKAEEANLTVVDASSRRLGLNQTVPLFDALMSTIEANLSVILKDLEQARGNLMGVYAFVTNMLKTTNTLAVLLGIGMVAFVLFRVGRPLSGLHKAMLSIADGHTSVTIPSLKAQNEIGDMARSLAIFRDHLIEAERLRAYQQEQERSLAQRIHQQRLEIAAQFKRDIASLIEQMSQMSSAAAEAAQTLTEAAESTSEQVAEVVSAASNASHNAQVSAAATEQMSGSVVEIGEQIERSGLVVTSATQAASDAEAGIANLTEAANQIGEVINLIREIASRTNLLALNATIESARAGEAGRGFSVVAFEVKQLAAQTSGATDDIACKVQEIQEATGASVEAIQRIAETVRGLQQTTLSIAAAVREQEYATREIAQSTVHTARGAEQVTQSIDGVSRSAQRTGAAAEALRELSRSLSGATDALDQQVGHFMGVLRAG